MKVGIIVYSKTGNTMSVAQKLEKAIKCKGHTVNIARIETINEDTNSALKNVPDVSQYDVLIFASPVHAFSLAPAMKSYLSQLPNLTGKKIYCFVTQQLKKAWLGGNHAIKQITSICKEKKEDVIWGGVINWASNIRENQIDDIITKLSQFN